MKQQLQLDFSSTENNSSDEFDEIYNMAADSKYPKKPDIVMSCYSCYKPSYYSDKILCIHSLSSQGFFSSSGPAALKGF
jgi:hypothetical protein